VFEPGVIPGAAVFQPRPVIPLSGVSAPRGSYLTDFFLAKVNSRMKPFRKSQFQHKFVNPSFIITNRKNKLTNCGGIDFRKTALKTLRIFQPRPVIPLFGVSAVGLCNQLYRYQLYQLGPDNDLSVAC
jgi:hypothetical protein